MPKSLNSLDSHTNDILDGRRRAKHARFKPLPSGVEHLDAVLEQAIDFLVARLAVHGFKAAKSQLALSHKVGEITQVIRLRPSGSNLSGVSVEVSAEALVRSSSLKRWTSTVGTKYARETLWIRQLGYLAGHNEYYKWQLVDPKTREVELADLLSKVELIALPALEAWATKDSIATAVFRRSEVDRIDWLVEAALWAGSTAAAAGLLSDHLANNPNYRATFASELRRFRADLAIGEPQTSAISGLAFLAARHAIPVPDDG